MDDENSPIDDEAALEFALRLLQEEPDVTYKEARRAARAERKISLRRQTWTAARRQLGMAPADDDAPLESPETAHPRPSAEAPRPRPPQRGPGGRDPGGIDDGRREPPWRRRHEDHGAPAAPRPPREDSPWPGRRPAWASPPQRPADPAQPVSGAPPALSPSSVFLKPARNAIEFMIQYLKTVNAEATFDEVEEAAGRSGYTVYPATFGRAQALAGLLDDDPPTEPVRVAPASQPVAGPAADPKPPRGSPAVAASSTPSTSAGTDPVAALEVFRKAMEALELDRQRCRRGFRAMLEAVQQALAD